MTTHGIVLLDKPLGMSSNSATQRVRRLLSAKSAGHIGSLDPLASGMLPICLNEATKVISEILPGRKHYRFTVTLGARTATGDAEGEVVERSPVPPLDAAGVSAALAKLVGVQQQVPPMYSALKRAGEPLYKIARRGETVERAAREIVIHQAKLLALAPQTIECDLLCGKGTYVTCSQRTWRVRSAPAVLSACCGESAWPHLSTARCRRWIVSSPALC